MLNNDSELEGIQMMLGKKPFPEAKPVIEHTHVSDGFEYNKNSTEVTYFCVICNQHYQIKLRHDNTL